MFCKPQSLAELVERAEQVRCDFAGELAANRGLKLEATTLLDLRHEIICDLERIERRGHQAISESAKRFAPRR